MMNCLLRRVTSRDSTQYRVLAYSRLALSVLSLLDLSLRADIVLHGLYIFPLAAIVFSSTKRHIRLGAYTATVFLQLFAILYEAPLHLVEALTCLTTLFVSTLVYLVADVARVNYGEANKLSTLDPLTGIFNRRGFEAALEIEFSRQRRYGGTSGMVMLDLDGFKALNDRLGHCAGDRALISVAKALQVQTRASDLVSRFGGDEFALFLPNIGQEDCAKICVKISHCLSVEGLKASIGSIVFESAPESVKDAYEAVDSVMYAAKLENKRFYG